MGEAAADEQVQPVVGLFGATGVERELVLLEHQERLHQDRERKTDEQRDERAPDGAAEPGAGTQRRNQPERQEQADGEREHHPERVRKCLAERRQGVLESVERTQGEPLRVDHTDHAARDADDRGNNEERARDDGRDLGMTPCWELLISHGPPP